MTFWWQLAYIVEQQREILFCAWTTSLKAPDFIACFATNILYCRYLLSPLFYQASTKESITTLNERKFLAFDSEYCWILKAYSKDTVEINILRSERARTFTVILSLRLCMHTARKEVVPLMFNWPWLLNIQLRHASIQLRSIIMMIIIDEDR